MTNYQLMILEALQVGARLKSTEGENYKCWLIYPNGERKNVRRDSAEKVCEENGQYLVFGEYEGIRWREPRRIKQANKTKYGF